MEISLILLSVAILAAAVIVSRRPGSDNSSLSSQEITRHLSDAVSRLQVTMAGSYSRGKFGEEMLEQAISELPPEMVARDLPVAGKVVEFAIRMPDGKMLPVDSKWPGASLLPDMESNDLEVVDAARKRIDAMVVRKIGEVAQYIDTSITLPMAVLALPDSVFFCCRKSHGAAVRSGVIIVSFTMVLPYLMTVWNLRRAYGGDIDEQRVVECLHQASKSLSALSHRLEGKLSRSLTTALNSVGEIRALASSASAAIAAADGHVPQTDEIREDEPLPLVTRLLERHDRFE